MASLAATAGCKKSRWFGDAGSADAHLKQRRDLLKFQTGKSLEISISLVSPEFVNCPIDFGNHFATIFVFL